MKKFIHILVLLLMAFMLVNTETVSAQDDKRKLDDFEKEVEKTSDSDDDDDDDDGDHDWDGNGGGILSDLLGQLCWEMVEGTVRIVFFGLPADYDASYKLNNFSKYPYAKTGNYYSNISRKTNSLHIKTSGYAALDNITGVEERISFSIIPAISLTGQFSSLTENLDGSRDVMNLGTAFINYNRFRTRRVRYSYGLGLKFLERDNLYTGPAMNFEFDWFMKKPVSAYWYWNGGLLNGNGVTGTQIGMNYHVRHVCFGCGYRGYRAGSVKIHGLSFSFGGYF